MEPFWVNRGILAQKMMTVIVSFFLSCQILIISRFHNLIFISIYRLFCCKAWASSQLKESVKSRLDPSIAMDLIDSKDPKHTLFCREIGFVAIYALLRDNISWKYI